MSRRRRRDSWWKCQVPAPFCSDWVRWEETYRRMGLTWLGGFNWCHTASPGRYINTGPKTSSTPLVPRRLSLDIRQDHKFVFAAVPSQLDTVQSVQFWGVRGELSATSSSSSSSVVNVPVIMQRRCSWFAVLCSTVDTIFCVCLGDFWKNF